MIISEQFGQALQHQKIVPGDTVVAADAQCYKYGEYTLLANGVDAGSTIVAAFNIKKKKQKLNYAHKIRSNKGSL